MAKITLTRLNEILKKQTGHIFHVGIDVHKKSYHIAFYCKQDGQTYTYVCSAVPDQVVEQFTPFINQIVQVVYEAGPTGFGLARALKQAGFEVLVVAPSRVSRPVIAGAKTDRLDCMRLAEYSAKGMLKGIAIPSSAQEARRSLIRRRHDLTDSIRTVKQRIRSHLLFLGVVEPVGLDHWSDKAVKALMDLPMETYAKDTMKSLIRELSFLKEERRQLEKQIRDVCTENKNDRTFEFLQTTPGVGPVTAATFQLELFDPGRFENGDQVASYVGLAPMVRRSGETKGSTRLRPVGQKRLRSLLIEAAWTWRRKDEMAKDKFCRIMGKSNITQKAIVAVAKDLVVVLWRLSIEQRAYQTRTLAA